MRSVGVDLLQMIDLILGAIVYDFKATDGTVESGNYRPKVQLLDHIKESVGIDSFVGGHRDAKLNVQLYHG